MNREAIFNQMTESPEGEELNYPLTEHTGVYITSIVFRDDKWYLNVWNDYQDDTAWEDELEEKDAIEYIVFDAKERDLSKKKDDFIKGMFKEMEENKSYFIDYLGGEQ